MDDKVVCDEQYGSHQMKHVYVKKSDNSVHLVDRSQRFISIKHVFKAAFLPVGWPESVSHDYMDYQIWDTIQAFCSYTISTLATQAVMVGYGVGDHKATAAAATITWILKNLTGYMGRIFFTWYQGLSFDSDCKRWRLAADVLNDTAICLEIFAPYFKQYFTLIVCAAELTRNVCGAAGSATRAAMTMHQARRDNMADVSAKDGSQETCVHSLSLLFGLILIPMVAGSQSAVWTLFAIFTTSHLLANYKAVRAVVMESLNQSRLHILIEHYLGYDGFVMSLRDTNIREPVIFKTKRKLSILLGSQMFNLIERVDDLRKLGDIAKSKPYLIQINFKKGFIYIALNSRSKLSDQLQSCFHAEVINFAVENASHKKYRDMRFIHDIDVKLMFEAALREDAWSLLELSTRFTEKHHAPFIAAIQNEGWITSVNLLGASEWRASWDSHKHIIDIEREKCKIPIV